MTHTAIQFLVAALAVNLCLACQTSSRRSDVEAQHLTRQATNAIKAVGKLVSPITQRLQQEMAATNESGTVEGDPNEELNEAVQQVMPAVEHIGQMIQPMVNQLPNLFNFLSENKESIHIQWKDRTLPCGSYNMTRGEYLTIESINYPNNYFKDWCQWTFRCDRIYRHQMSLRCESFEMEGREQNGSCERDWLQVKHPGWPIHKRFCGYEASELNQVKSPRGKLRLTYKADESNNYKGFRCHIGCHHRYY